MVMRFELDTRASVARVRCPVLVLHSPYDEIVPYAQGRTVFAAAHPPKVFQDLAGDHNGGFMLSQPGYQRGLESFLARTSQAN